jgi:opacity protein-like surface antigen
MSSTLPRSRAAMISAAFAAGFGALAAAPAAAQWSASAGFETTSGKYGKPERTDETLFPVSVAYRQGPWRFRAGAPLVKRVEGTAIAAAQDGEIEEPDPGEQPEPGAGPITSSQSQTGPSDLHLSAFYALWDAGVARPGLNVGVRVKTPLSSKDKCLITNGATDTSLEARAHQTYGAIEPFVALGWTKRGDPDRRDENCVATGGTIDLKNPFYLRAGVSLPLSAAVALDVEYEYRQKIRSGGDPKSEIKAGASWRMNKQFELVGYGIVGFSDASPDRGIGAYVVYRF